MGPEDGVGGTEPAPVRRAKVYQPKNVDLSQIDLSRLTIEDLGPVSTMEEMEARARRPVARLRSLATAPRRALVKQLVRRRSLRQRRTRGWTDSELWNLDVHVCQHVGSMLAAQVDEVRNHPPELDHAEWCSQVAQAGEALLAYDPDDARRVTDARGALRWVADNLVDLWD